MVTNIQLKSGEHLVSITIEEDDGSVSEKKVTLQNLAEVFKVESKNEYYCKNAVFDELEDVEKVDGLIYGCKEDTTIKGLFFVPADNRYMNVAGETALMPYPSLIFQLVAQAGNLVNSTCFAVLEKDISKIKPTTKLYAFPYGNVHTVNHQICWGSNPMNTLFDYGDLRKAIATFFYSESNKDYVRPGASYSKKYGDYEAFLACLKGHNKFPKNALVECYGKLTFKDVFGSIYSI